MLLRLPENGFVSQKIEFVHFCLCPKQISPPGFYQYYSRQEEVNNFPQTTFFVFFLSRKGGLWSKKYDQN